MRMKRNLTPEVNNQIAVTHGHMASEGHVSHESTPTSSTSQEGRKRRRITDERLLHLNNSSPSMTTQDQSSEALAECNDTRSLSSTPAANIASKPVGAVGPKIVTTRADDTLSPAGKNTAIGGREPEKIARATTTQYRGKSSTPNEHSCGSSRY